MSKESIFSPSKSCALMDCADSILKWGTDRCWLSAFRSIIGQGPPDVLLTINRCEYTPGPGSFTGSMAPFFNIKLTSFSNASHFRLCFGSDTGWGVLESGGRDLNFSFNPSLIVSKPSDLRWSFPKCFSLPPTGRSVSCLVDGRVNGSRISSLGRGGYILCSSTLGLTCSVRPAPHLSILTMGWRVVFGLCVLHSSIAVV